VYAITTLVRKTLRLVAAGAMAALMLSGTAWAQDDPNTGALTFTGAFDVLPGSTYMFRGINQEALDPQLTMWPYADLGIALGSSEGAVKSASINFGVWNSLHTGSSGSKDGGYLHYEEDFYGTLTLGFGGSIALGTTYTAYTSPNGRFDTVNELSFKVAQTSRIAPYGIIAFEMGEGTADAGKTDDERYGAGTYLELGVGPAFPLGMSSATVTFPIKLGMSLSDYYEYPTLTDPDTLEDHVDAGEDKKFGFFDIGALVTMPLPVPSRFGSWNVHGGVDFLMLGDTTEALNNNESTKFTGLFGIGVSY
jgi:hypothetical protein